MTVTPDEVADVQRDAVALLRAALSYDFRGMEAILDGAGERGTWRIAALLAASAADAITRWTVTASFVTDTGAEYDAVRAADMGTLLAQPEIRAAVDANVARLQGVIVAGGRPEG